MDSRNNGAAIQAVAIYAVAYGNWAADLEVLAIYVQL
jgi:hypothetical protein